MHFRRLSLCEAQSRQKHSFMVELQNMPNHLPWLNWVQIYSALFLCKNIFQCFTERPKKVDSPNRVIKNNFRIFLRNYYKFFRLLILSIMPFKIIIWFYLWDGSAFRFLLNQKVHIILETTSRKRTKNDPSFQTKSSSILI